MDKLHSINFIDEKTNFKNYDAFVTDFESLISESIKSCTDLSLIMIDIDNLTEINNEFGYTIGDNVLLSISRYLADNMPDNAQIYRFNGDKFAMLLPDTEKESAYLIIERMHSYYYENSDYKIKDKSTTIESSFCAGVSCCPEDGVNSGILVRRAHSALLRSKTSGKNKVALSKVEKFISKKTLYTTDQLQQLSILSKNLDISEGILLREALDDLIKKYDK